MSIIPNQFSSVRYPHLLSDVKEVRFSIFSPNEILRNSVTPEGIHIPKVYEKGKPIVGGLMDARLGVFEEGEQCPTCQNYGNECTGHFGHIRLAKPIFHALFFNYTVKLLRCICLSCCKLLVSPYENNVKAVLEKTANNAQLRFKGIYSLCANRRVCQRKRLNYSGCGIRKPKLIAIGLKIKACLPEETRILTAENVYKILSRITDDTCTLLGMKPCIMRPEMLILQVLPVAPVTARPASMYVDGIEEQSDITHIYANIVTHNNALEWKIRNFAKEDAINESLQWLQYHVGTLFVNKNYTVPIIIPKRGYANNFEGRLTGKEGRIRRNLMGKRVDHCARSVISPDPNIRLNEIGVPLSIAMSLTYPETVTSKNIEHLQTLVNRGPNAYPGAKFVRTDYRCIALTSGTNVNLQCGQVVERTLMNNDLVVGNRTPTLHKMSMMGHRVKVLPHDTLRLNLSSATPYNADFDGDEMNIHVPQSTKSKAEIEYLELVSRQIITPQYGKPVMGIIQDALTGVSKLSSRDAFLKYHDLMNLLMHFPDWNGVWPKPCILKPIELWSGKQLISMLIPNNINMRKTHTMHPKDENTSCSKWLSAGDTHIVIDNGMLVCGMLCKKTFSDDIGSLIHIICLDKGTAMAAEFIDNVQAVVNAWLLLEGFSIGIEDVLLNADVASQKEEHYRSVKSNVRRALTQSMSKDVESEIVHILNDNDNDFYSHFDAYWRHNNSLRIMQMCGSKGSKVNSRQIMLFLGQQFIQGKRVPFLFKKRSLPHFSKTDFGPESRGFIRNSFTSGLSPFEFFFHAMCGWDSFISGRGSTADAGYFHRRLTKALESVMVQYDGTVRNSMGKLISTAYGSDGFCGEKLDFGSIKSLQLSDAAFKKQHKFERANLEKVFTANIVKQLRDSSAFTRIDVEYEQLCQRRNILRENFTKADEMLAVPCDVQRLMWNAKNKFYIDANAHTDLSPLHVIGRVRRLHKQDNEHDTSLFNYFLRSSLCVKRVCEKMRLSTKAFDWLIDDIERRFRQAQVAPGEMVGVLAAQSLCEPTTQMTLNTFHFAGVKSRNVGTCAIGRLNEIFNCSRKIKFPALTIHLANEVAHDITTARNLASALVHTTLADVFECSGIYYDQSDHCSIFTQDQLFINRHYEKLKPTDTLKDVSQWLLRIEFNRPKMKERKLKLKTILEKINQSLALNLYGICSSDYAEKLVMRLRIKAADIATYEQDAVGDAEAYEVYQMLEQLVNKVHIAGIKGISMASIKDADDGYFLKTKGTALCKVLCLKNVNTSLSYSNHIWELAEVLGVDAAYQSIVDEADAVYRSQNIYLNSRHLLLIADVMLAEQYLTSFTRHGLITKEVGVLNKASFEQPIAHLVNAGVFCEKDNIESLSSQTILGKLGTFGTNCFNLLCDSSIFESMEIETKKSKFSTHHYHH